VPGNATNVTGQGVSFAMNATKSKQKRQAESAEGTLPRRPRGRPSPEADARYWASVEVFADAIKEIASRLDFKPSSRGWCYALEGEGYLTKADFDACQRLINDCRKRGILSLDICREDDKRQFENLEEVTDDSPDEFAAAYVRGLAGVPKLYCPMSFWEDKDCYVQNVVEKIDLKDMFKPVCAPFRLPIANAGGWGDLHVRANMMRRFKFWEEKGKTPVLLYCGDFDPGGVLMSDTLMSNMAEMELAVGWSPENVIIDRFGLNLDFIEVNNLTWIDNLITGGKDKMDLANPKHPDHNKPHVQKWLRDIGARKVEANALVVNPEAGRKLCLEAICKYVDLHAPDEYQSGLEYVQDEVHRELQRMVKVDLGGATA
jgi:hypothetical protein